MAFVRMLVSWGPASYPVEDRLSNTLYFNVSGSVDDPDYQALANDLRDIYGAQAWTAGSKIEVRAYDMADEKPRPERAFSTVTKTGTFPACANQVALCLSYYADRNLPRRRGRIYTGPWPASASYASGVQQGTLLTMAQALADLGGVNVDWSVYSPTTAAGGQDGHWRITRAWTDNSWDIVRSRKLKATARGGIDING